MADKSIEISRSARKRAGRASAKASEIQPPLIDRRTFLRLALLGGSALAAGSVGKYLIEAFGASQAKEKRVAFLRSVEVPEFAFDPSNLARFNSLFKESYISTTDDFPSLSAEEQTAVVSQEMNETTRRMDKSGFGAFTQTTQIFAEVLKKGVLILEVDAPADGLGLKVGALFATGPIILANNNLGYVVTANGYRFEPKAIIEDPNSALRFSWGIGLLHELLGHYALSEKIKGFLNEQGISDPSQVIAGLKDDPYQEPYAYAVTAQAWVAAKKGGFAYKNMNVDSLDQIAVVWEKHLAKGGKWYESAWLEYIADYLGTPSPFGKILPNATFAAIDFATQQRGRPIALNLSSFQV